MSYHLKHHRRRDDDTDVDDWLMTYADMITLLLCFFAVLLAVSVPKKEKFEEALEQMRAEFSIQKTPQPIVPPKPQIIEPIKSNLPLDAMPSIVGDATPRDGMDNEGIKNVEKEGDRISILEMDSTALFASGQAVLSTEGQNLLRGILPDLNKDPDFTITVEGHTDDQPIATAQFPSNWELSTARAAAVVRYLIEMGIPPARLRATGYADAAPKVPNRNEAGLAIPDNQAQNRRVVIKLEKIEPGR